MLASRWRRAVHTILTVLLALTMASGTAAVAHAEVGGLPDGWNQDQWKRFQALPQQKKDELRDQTIAMLAQKKCDDSMFYANMGNNDRCEERVRTIMRDHLYKTAEQVLGVQKLDGSWCQALEAGGAGGAAVTNCRVGGALMFVGAVKNVVDKQRNDIFMGAIGGAIAVVKFIADPKTALDNLANDFKDQSVEGTKQVLNTLTSVTGLDANSKEYRSVWAAFAGVGVVVMTFMMLMLFKRYGEGKVSDDSFGTSMMYYLPGGFLLAIFGPGLMGLAQKWSSGLTDGASGWAAGAINNFITVIAGFGAMKSTDWFGSVLAVILFGILLLGAFGLLVFLLLSPFFMGFAGLAVAILWGLALVPSLRPRLAKVGSVVVLMIFMKPIVFVLLGGVFSILAATPAFKEGTDDMLVNVGSLAATGIILLLLTFSPALLFKFMPVLDADDVPSGAGGAALAGGVAGAVTGGAGRAFSNLQQNGRARRRAAADSHGGGAGSQGGGGQASSAQNSGTQAGWGSTGAGADAGGSSSSTSSAAAGPGAGAGGGAGGGSRRQRRDDQARANDGGSVRDQATGAGTSAGGSGSAGSQAATAGSGTGTGLRSGGRRVAVNAASSGGGGSSALAKTAGVMGAPIKSGLVGALWAGRESARAARRAATDYGQMPTSWGNFKGAPNSREQE